MKNILLLLIFIPVFLVSCDNSGIQKSESPEISVSQETAIVDPDKLLAKVNDIEIRQENLRNRTLEDTIDDEILYIEANSRGITYDMESEDYYIKKHRTISNLRAEFLREIYKESKPTEEEILAYYESKPEKYTYLTILQIDVLGKEEVANKVRKEAKKLKSFKRLSKLQGKFKDEAKAVRVGVVGQKRLMAYRDVLAPSKGFVSNVISEDKFNHKIYVVTDVQKMEVSNFKNAIRHTLLSLQKYNQFKQWVEELKKTHNIKVETF
ncbi:MAG: hypothetical protein GTO02_22250 [Candidatus Dadabacteria bacterium]|nr:hypothetical protein [Candidatus Dadabacteria bacterium]NIQ17002.1 hypothetical protein [Candidatus Dadabacteria bacterium]